MLASRTSDEEFGKIVLEVRLPRFYSILLAGSANVLLGSAAVVLVALPPGALRVTITIVLLTFGLTTALAAFYCKLNRLSVFEDGIAQRILTGTIRLAYGDVTDIRLPGQWRMGIANPLGSACLSSTDGRRVKARMLPQLESLKAMTFALERIQPRLGEEALSRLGKGEGIAFGKCRASLTGLALGSKIIRWSEIERANLSPEGLRVFPKNRPEATMILPLATPNLYVLIWLCRQLQADAATIFGRRNGGISQSDASLGLALAERVRGFPDHDPQLGEIVCGKPRSAGKELMPSLLLLGGLAAALAILIFKPAILGPADLAWVWASGLGGAALIGILAMRYAIEDVGFGIYETGICTAKARLMWEECEHVTHRVTDLYIHGTFAKRHAELQLEGQGIKIAIGGTDVGNEGLCAAILAKVLPPLVARWRRELLAGAEFTVGAVILVGDAVILRRERVPLGQIQECTVQGGYLCIWRLGVEMPFRVDAGRRDVPVFSAVLNCLIQKGS